MAKRRGIPKSVNWFLREWMDALGVTQAEMCRRTGWSKATASQLYNNVQDYSPKVMNEAAQALNAATYELLMPYARAMAFRGFQADALKIVESSPPPATPAPSPRVHPLPKRRKSG